MDRLPAAPPDIASLSERIRVLGGGIATTRDEIERLKAPGFDGLWVTTDGERWSFRSRQRRRRAA